MRVTKLLGLGVGLAGASYATYVASTFLRYGHVKAARGNAADPFVTRRKPESGLSVASTRAIIVGTAIHTVPSRIASGSNRGSSFTRAPALNAVNNAVPRPCRWWTGTRCSVACTRSAAHRNF